MTEVAWLAGWRVCVCCLLKQRYPTASAESVSAVLMLCQEETPGHRLLHQPFLLFNRTMNTTRQGKWGKNREHEEEEALHFNNITSSRLFVKKIWLIQFSPHGQGQLFNKADINHHWLHISPRRYLRPCSTVVLCIITWELPVVWQTMLSCGLSQRCVSYDNLLPGNSFHWGWAIRAAPQIRCLLFWMCQEHHAIYKGRTDHF